MEGGLDWGVARIWGALLPGSLNSLLSLKVSTLEFTRLTKGLTPWQCARLSMWSRSKTLSGDINSPLLHKDSKEDQRNGLR